jgi:hypothetical protein
MFNRWMERGLALAFVLAICSPARAQSQDPTLDPDYDAKKAAAVAATTTTTTTTVTHSQPTPGGMPRNAFVFEARLSLGGTLAAGGSTALGGANGIGGGNATYTTIPGVIAQPSLFLGARLLDRLQVGLNIAFVRVGGPGFSSNNILFLPTVAIDLAKSSDNKTAFYIKPGLGFGAAVAVVTGGKDASAIVDIDIALGARHAFSSSFGLGFEAGLSASVTNPGNSAQSDVVFLYGALVGTFWSGK